MNTNWNNQNDIIDGNGQSVAVPKTFVSNVMVLMSLGLLITGVLAYLFGNSENLMSLLYSYNEGGRSMTALGWIVMLAPLGLVFGLGAAYRKFSSNAMILLFVVFSALLGMSLSSIFMSVYCIVYITYLLYCCGYVWHNGCCRIYHKRRPDKNGFAALYGLNRNYHR